MKRPRSYGEDLDDDWPPPPRRDQDHRRFYSKSERKGSASSASYDRTVDDDRESSRSLRKRFDHETDGFDRRRGFDRYRDNGGDRPSQVSPRGVYGSSDRMYRSESFSGLRREFPKGFRSERDRSRREGSSGSSWRRSSSGKEAVVEAAPASAAAADEELRSPARDSNSAGKGGSHGASSEDHRGKVRCRDQSSGEQSRRLGAAKAEKPSKESCSSSEMEEGELEPDPEPQAKPAFESSPESKTANLTDSENCKDKETECSSLPETVSLGKDDLPSEKKMELNVRVASEAKEGEKAMDKVGRAYEVTAQHGQPDSVKEADEERREEGEGTREGAEKDDNVNRADEVGSIFCAKKREIPHEEIPLLLSEGQDVEGKKDDEVIEEKEKETASSVSPPKKQSEEHHVEGQGVEAEVEASKKEEIVVDLGAAKKGGRGFDLEAEPDGASGLLDADKEAVGENSREEATLKLLTDKPQENYKDKGKSLVVSTSSKLDSGEHDDPVEGPIGRGFELVFRSNVFRPENVHGGGVVIGNETFKMEPLDLSLSLPGVSADHTLENQNPKPDSPSRARSIQSFPSSFRTISDGFTTSISFSSSQPFVHNPSCSLTQTSLDNYEQSVGSHPIFQGVDQVSNGSIWQAQNSNETKRKAGAAPLFQRVLLNGNASQSSFHALNGQHQLKANGLSRQSSLPRQLSPSHSNGSHDTRPTHSKDKRLLTRGRSSSSLLRGDQREGEQLVINGSGIIERIVSKIVAEPLNFTGRMLQGMTEHSVAYLKETICEMISSPDKIGQILALQEALKRRSDLTVETMSKCPHVLLEILVAIKTGLPDFIKRITNVPSSDLVEIFLNLKCRNLACRSVLPVDDCDCKVCTQKNGFCSACMCLVCSKFDMASNTCSWVGCDVCLHWCHTDCGLQNSHIRNGQSSSGALGMTEMQFHCVACDHPSEMFGFVKEVFRTCSKDWKADTLAKELQYVRRIFSGSNDVRGKRLYDVAGQMLVKLEKQANHSEVINYIMTFLSDSESNFGSSHSVYLPKEPSRNNDKVSNGIASSSKVGTWLPSVPSEKVLHLENSGVLPSINCDRVSGQTRDAEKQINLEKKPVVDELESVVKFKQAEAEMYQDRADDARREAEGLKRIAMAKNAKIEEDYASQIAKLGFGEAEERRRQKLEELQVIERAHREYCNMKMRMEADIKDLLLKMEAAKRNLNT